MFPAKMIVDFNNPTSMKYAEVCVKTWENVLDVEMIQCITPETLPKEKHWSPYWNRSATEKAIICSFLGLLEKIAEGDDFFILEHDAYLFPYEIRTFKDHIETRHNYYYLNPGKACECQWFSQKAARDFIDDMELANSPNSSKQEHTKFKGPLGCVVNIIEKKSDKKNVFPFMPRIHNEQYAYITNGLSIITKSLVGTRCVLANDDKGRTDPSWSEDLIFLPACVNQIVDYKLLTTQQNKSTGKMLPKKQIDWTWVDLDYVRNLYYN